jgi:hypothetical protein
MYGYRISTGTGGAGRQGGGGCIGPGETDFEGFEILSNTTTTISIYVTPMVSDLEGEDIDNRQQSHEESLTSEVLLSSAKHCLANIPS